MATPNRNRSKGWPGTKENCEAMTEYIVRHTGKVLFPHLARDQRKRLMTVIVLVLATSFASAGGLVMWMTSYRH